jgi:hypothetical protein
MQQKLQHFEVIERGCKDPGKMRVCNVIRFVFFVCLTAAFYVLVNQAYLQALPL